jgi:rhodanese-related sulfurtransferase
VAASFRARGFERAVTLRGGVEGWKKMTSAAR